MENMYSLYETDDISRIDPGLVLPGYASQCDNLTCSICCMCCFDPVMCGSCEHLFCKDCIIGWKKKSKNCPNRCIYKETPIPRFARSMITSIKFKCPHSNRGCTDIVDYSTFFNHLIACKYLMYKCDYPNCGFKGVLSKVTLHVQDCPYSSVVCDLCSSSFSRKFFESHKKICADSTLKCGVCNKDIKRLDWLNHDKLCEMVQVACKYCEVRFTRKYHLEHQYNKEECFRKLKSQSEKTNEALLESLETMEVQYSDLESKFFLKEQHSNVAISKLKNESLQLKEQLKNAIMEKEALVSKIKAHVKGQNPSNFGKSNNTGQFSNFQYNYNPQQFSQQNNNPSIFPQFFPQQAKNKAPSNHQPQKGDVFDDYTNSDECKNQ